MKMEHEFKAEHGFTGSAHKGKDFRPKIHGYKHGGEVEEKIADAIHEHEDHEHGGMHTRLKMKKGGKSHDAKDHYGKSKVVDHDGEMHTGHVKYDEHGFQSHFCKGGMAKGGKFKKK